MGVSWKCQLDCDIAGQSDVTLFAVGVSRWRLGYAGFGMRNRGPLPCLYKLTHIPDLQEDQVSQIEPKTLVIHSLTRSLFINLYQNDVLQGTIALQTGSL